MFLAFALSLCGAQAPSTTSIAPPRPASSPTRVARQTARVDLQAARADSQAPSSSAPLDVQDPSTAHTRPQTPSTSAHVLDEKVRERIESLAREAIDKDGVPGLSIAVGRDGDLVFAQGWGYADAARGVPATADTVYDIGSLTRQFTAVSVLELAEKKKLALDDEITKWLPDFPMQGRKITLRQLVHDTSGIPGYAALAAKHKSEMNRELTREQFFELFKDVPFESAPGEGFSLDNCGYVLLPMVIAKASGQEYADYVRTHLLEPLELAHTTLCPTKDRPVGFAQDCKQPSDGNVLAMPSLAGAAASPTLCSTAKDLVRWQRALSDRQLIGEQSTREMTTPKDLGDGLATGTGFTMVVDDRDHSVVYSQTGCTGGFRVRLAHYAAQHLTLVVLANCATAPVERLEKSIATAVLDIVPAEIVDLPVDANEVSLDAGNWQIATTRIRTFEKDGKLWYERAGDPPFALMYQGKRVFVASTDHAMRITFKSDDGKPAETFEILRNGLVSVGKRME